MGHGNEVNDYKPEHPWWREKKTK